MHFNSPKQKFVGLFDIQERDHLGRRKEDKVAIDELTEMYKHAERLKNTVKHYISD